MIKIKHFALLFCLITPLLASNIFLQDKGIVDIGRTLPSNTVVVGKSIIYSSPILKTIPNNIVYQPRIQSPKYNCGTDDLGHEGCEFQETQCQGVTDYTSAKSVKHHVVKNLLKICPQGTIEMNGLCYIGHNGIRKDFKEFSTKHSGSGRICADQPGWLIARQDSNELHVGVYAGTGNCGGSGYKYLSNIQVPSNIQVNTLHMTYSAGCLGSGSDTIKTGASFTAYKTNRGCDDRGAQHPYVSISYYYSYTKCPSGYKSDGMYCYQPPHCPQYSYAQPDGMCKMSYNWYSYTCPDGNNIYDNAWKVINAGHNCGNPSCTNSPTPPLNDCERENHVCPLNKNTVCSQIQINKPTCPTGYVFHDNVCERKATFCGSSYYNSQLDVCQNITEYTKLCTDPHDVYNPTTNTCESNQKACPNGIYNKSLGLCTSNYQITCATPGYVYNASSGYCVNPNLVPCPNYGYHYDAAKHECIGPLECPNGMTYVPSLNKCENVVCGPFSTINTDGLCVSTHSDCSGIITKDHRCIPRRRVQ